MRKEYLVWLLIGIAFVGIASAELIHYYIGRTEVSFEVNETGAFFVNQEKWANFSVKAGEGYSLNLWGAINNLPLNVSTVVNVSIQEFNPSTDEWNMVTDDEGFYIAFSDSIKCCLPDYCLPLDDMTGIEDCGADYQRWMNINPTWVNWYITEPSSQGYDQNMVKPSQGKTYIPFDNGVASFPVEIHPGQFYSVLYIGTDARLKGGMYRLFVDV